jgi:hypothetical protein
VIAAKLGMPAKAWAKHRAVLLRGWSPADDGRLYHVTLTQRVLEMMQRRRSDSDRQAERRRKAAEESARQPAASRVDPHGVTDMSRVTPAGVHRESSTDHRPPNTEGEGIERESAKPRAAVASPHSRGIRLPTGWTPEPVHMAFAEGLGLRNGKAAAELEKFRDYWAAQQERLGQDHDRVDGRSDDLRRLLQAQREVRDLPAQREDHLADPAGPTEGRDRSGPGC